MHSKLLKSPSDAKNMRRLSLVIIVAVIVLYILMIFFRNSIESNSATINSVESTENSAKRVSIDYESVLNASLQNILMQEAVIIRKPENSSIKALGVVNTMREEIALEMEDFEIDNEMIELSKFTPETNGNPIRSVILSTWRSGSSFFGDILNSLPGSYYFFEPLIHYGDIQIRNDSRLVTEGTTTLHKLMKCNFSGMYRHMGRNLLRYNTRLYKFCGTVIPYKMCKTDQTFMSNFCSLFPFQVIKEVRLRPDSARALLMDTELNVKIVLLIRDPRGIVSSRKRERWCFANKAQECGYYANLCQDLTSDFKAAKYLTKKYPQRFKVIRYEDLSLNAYEVIEDVLDFYGLPFRDEVKEFLKKHTNYNSGDSMSTYRDSKRAAFSWRHSLTFAEVDQVQAKCIEAMNLWGYRKFNSEDELNNEMIFPMFKSPFAPEVDVI